MFSWEIYVSTTDAFLRNLRLHHWCIPEKSTNLLNSSAHKDDPQTHSPQRNKTAVLTTATFFKFSTRKVAETTNSQYPEDLVTFTENILNAKP